MWVAAAALVAPAVATAATGWYVFLLLALGVLFTVGTRQLGRVPGSDRGAPRWLLDGLTTAVGIGRVGLAAAVFAAYLFPSHPVAAGAGLVLVVTVAAAAGLRVDIHYRRWLAGTLLTTLAIFLAVCLAITPVPVMTSGREAADVPDAVAGLRALGVVFVPLSGLRAGAGVSWRRYAAPVTAVIGLVAVTAAAVYQLGPLRFGLSATSLRTVFVAADAQALLPVLAIAVVVATVPAALDGAGQAHAPFTGQRPRARILAVAVCGTAAIALVATLDPVRVLLTCAALLLCRVIALVVGGLRPGRVAPTVVVIVVACGILLVLPPVSLLSGLVVVAVGVAAGWLGQRVCESF